MRLAIFCSTVLISAGLMSPAWTQPLPPAAPEKAGFSKEGLARIDAFFSREIAANRVPGAYSWPEEVRA